MATTLKYTFRQINDIASSGFHFEIPEDTYNMINYLSLEVGSVGISSPVFSRTDKDSSDSISKDNSFSSGNNISNRNKKKKGNKSMEITSEEWETIRTFQATKIEQKTGIDGEIDQIRMLLNKLTDKTFLDMREKIIERINFLVNKI